jgi:UDP-glucose 4-epimerase
MTQRALVSGGAGFIGSHVSDILLANGYEVTVIDNLSSGKRDQVPTKASFKELDVCSPEAAALVRDGQFDVICHLAAQIDVRKSVTDPAADANLNIGGSLNLLQAVQQSGYKTRFVFSSTGGAVYGDLVEAPTSEEAPKDPQSPYGTAKFSVELYMGYFARVHGLDCVALRYANVYGPRQDPHGEAGVVAIFAKALLAGKPTKIFGDGSDTRDYVFVDDVVDAFVRASGQAGSGQRFNAGTGIETSTRALHTAVAAAAGTPDEPELHPPRLGDLRRSCLDNGRATDVLGWTPKVALAEGIDRTVAFFRDQLA